MNLLDAMPALLSGLWVTLRLTAGGAALAFVLAWLAGLGKLSTHRFLRWPAMTYIEVFRGTSALVQLYWFYFVLPLLGISLGTMTTGILVLGLNIGAYGAEVVRGAVNAVDRGQIESATALNLTRLQQLRLVIIPQALLLMLPPAGNLLIELLKSTALVSLITLNDLTFEGMILRAQSMETVQVFALLLVLYFAVSVCIGQGVRLLERRLARGWHLGGAHGL